MYIKMKSPLLGSHPSGLCAGEMVAGGSSKHSSLGMGMAAGNGTGGGEEEEEEEGAGADLGGSEDGAGGPDAFVWTEKKKEKKKFKHFV